MDILSKTDDEVYEIAKPIWDNLVKSSNLKIMVVLPKIFQLKCFLELMKLSLVSNGLTIK